MNLFAFFVKLNNQKRSKGWKETSARFTGRFEKVKLRTKYFQPANYNSYELVYVVKGKEKHGWYSFYPLPDPDADVLTNTTMQIRYKERDPYIFEAVIDEQV